VLWEGGRKVGVGWGRGGMWDHKVAAGRNERTRAARQARSPPAGTRGIGSSSVKRLRVGKCKYLRSPASQQS